MARFLGAAAEVAPGRGRRACSGRSPRRRPGRADAALDDVCDPMYARALRALIRDTISPDVIHAGVKYNVIPGDAIIEVDCRVLPGTTEPEMRAEVERRIGPDLLPACEIELTRVRRARRVAGRGPALGRPRVATIRDHDPDGIPLPFMVPFATDAKTRSRSGSRRTGSRRSGSIPASGISSASTASTSASSLDALRWGLPVLYDVVRRFCG